MTLSQSQLRMVAIIEAECERIGLGWLFEAAVTNAYAESLLDPNAVGDGGHSIGLFQLHDKGIGHGMTDGDRRDPVRNTRRVLEVVLSPAGDPVRQVQADGGNFEDLTAAFAQHIERCAACGHRAGDGELVRRRELAARLFPLPHPPPPSPVLT